MNTRFLPLHRLVKLSLATALLSLSLEATQANQATHQKGKPVFAWKVTNPKTNQIAYLVGSIHFGKKEFYPLPAVIEKAFAASDALVVEVDITKYPIKQEQSSIMLFFIQCLQGRFLSHKWDEPTLSLLEQALERTHITGYKKSYLTYYALPNHIVLILSEALQKEILGIAELGLERHFIPAAKKTNKTIIELEDIQTQQKMLAQLKFKPDFATLQAFLRDFSIRESLHKKTLLALQTGDTHLLDEVIEAYGIRILDYRKILLIDRNIIMTEKIKGFLQDDKTAFVLLGAMHYVGDTGILALLKKEGYIIEQLYDQAA